MNESKPRNIGEKKDLIRRLAKRTGIKRDFVERVLAAVPEVVREIAEEKGQCRWPRFGRFHVAIRGAHGYYDVAVHEMRVCGVRRRLKFTAYRAIQNGLNRRASDVEVAKVES